MKTKMGHTIIVFLLALALCLPARPAYCLAPQSLFKNPGLIPVDVQERLAYSARECEIVRTGLVNIQKALFRGGRLLTIEYLKEVAGERNPDFDKFVQFKGAIKRAHDPTDKKDFYTLYYYVDIQFVGKNGKRVLRQIAFFDVNNLPVHFLKHFIRRNVSENIFGMAASGIIVSRSEKDMERAVKIAAKKEAPVAPISPIKWLVAIVYPFVMAASIGSTIYAFYPKVIVAIVSMLGFGGTNFFPLVCIAMIAYLFFRYISVVKSFPDLPLGAWLVSAAYTPLAVNGMLLLSHALTAFIAPIPNMGLGENGLTALSVLILMTVPEIYIHEVLHLATAILMKMPVKPIKIHRYYGGSIAGWLFPRLFTSRGGQLSRGAAQARPRSFVQDWMVRIVPMAVSSIAGAYCMGCHDALFVLFGASLIMSVFANCFDLGSDMILFSNGFIRQFWKDVQKGDSVMKAAFRIRSRSVPLAVRVGPSTVKMVTTMFSAELASVWSDTPQDLFLPIAVLLLSEDRHQEIPAYQIGVYINVCQEFSKKLDARQKEMAPKFMTAFLNTIFDTQDYSDSDKRYFAKKLRKFLADNPALQDIFVGQGITVRLQAYDQSVALQGGKNVRRRMQGPGGKKDVQIAAEELAQEAA